jgi:hypothetical protein
MKYMLRGLSIGDKSGTRPDEPLLVESDFYGRAETLRSSLEQQLRSSRETNAGITPFVYADGGDLFRFLTASSERVFAATALDDLMEHIRCWATLRLGAQHVTTPQIRIYIKGCSRQLSRDAVQANWHYVLSLFRVRPGEAPAYMKLLVDGHPSLTAHPYLLHKLLKARLDFNHLLVHDTHHPYGVDSGSTSGDLLAAVVLLDGYLW